MRSVPSMRMCALTAGLALAVSMCGDFAAAEVPATARTAEFDEPTLGKIELVPGKASRFEFGPGFLLEATPTDYGWSLEVHMAGGSDSLNVPCIASRDAEKASTEGALGVRYGYTGTWCLSFAVESKQRSGLIEIGRRLLAFREEINSPGCDRFLQKTADGAIQFKLGDTQFSDCMEQLRKREMKVNADALRYQGSAGVLRLVQQSSAPLPSPLTLTVESWVPRQSETPKTIREVDWMNVLSTYHQPGELTPAFSDCGGRLPLVSRIEVAYGDLDGDGKEEAVVSAFSCLSGTGGRDIFGVFRLDGRGTVSSMPVHEKTALVRGKSSHFAGHKQLNLTGGKLVESFPLYREGDPNCCPTGGGREIHFRWSGSAFEVSAVKDNPPEPKNRLNAN